MCFRLIFLIIFSKIVWFSSVFIKVFVKKAFLGQWSTRSEETEHKSIIMSLILSMPPPMGRTQIYGLYSNAIQINLSIWKENFLSQTDNLFRIFKLGLIMRRIPSGLKLVKLFPQGGLWFHTIWHPGWWVSSDEKILGDDFQIFHFMRKNLMCVPKDIIQKEESPLDFGVDIFNQHFWWG